MFKDFLLDLQHNFLKYALGILIIGLVGFAFLGQNPVHSQDASTYYYPQSITVLNKTLTNANTEYSQAITAETRKLVIAERSGAANVKFTLANGASGTTYFTLKAGGTITLDQTYLNSKTLYMQSPTAGAVVEILIIKDE